MRQQRNLMVQSVEQYVFIYKALAEHQLFGDTDLTVLEYRSHFARLRHPYNPHYHHNSHPTRERHYSLSSASSKSANAIVSESTIPSGEKTNLSSRLKSRLSKHTAAMKGGIADGGGSNGGAGQQSNGVGLLGMAKPTQLEVEFSVSAFVDF